MTTAIRETAGYLRASDLPDDVRARVCNGAGPRGFGWLVPDLPGFTLPADDHDCGYAAGGTRYDRAMVDRRFLAELLEGSVRWAFFSCKASAPRLALRLVVLGLLCLAACWLYYPAVRLLGGHGPWTPREIAGDADTVAREARGETGGDS